MPFLNLPNETILQIAKEQEPCDLNSLLRTNRYLAQLLETALIDNVCAKRQEEASKGALYSAATRGDRPIVQRLIARSVLDYVGNGALLNDAVLTLDNDALRTLIDCGIDPETRDGEKHTPLAVAWLISTPSTAKGAHRCRLPQSTGTGRLWLFCWSIRGWTSTFETLSSAGKQNSSPLQVTSY